MLDTLRRIFLGSRERTYSYLLIAILLLLFVTPFITDSVGLSWLDDYLIIVVLLAALNNAATHRRHVMVGIVLGLLAIVARVASAHIEELPKSGHAAVTASTLVFLGYVVWHILNDVLRGRRLTAEKIIGAIVAYLMIGMVWAMAYMLVELFEPGSLRVPEDVVSLVRADPNEQPISVFVYYSFVTLSTLGYGDLTPVTATARTLSWVEAVVGPLYLAILVARLVGIQVAEAKDKDDDR
jgi:hypothetical protein